MTLAVFAVRDVKQQIRLDFSGPACVFSERSISCSVDSPDGGSAGGGPMSRRLRRWGGLTVVLVAMACLSTPAFGQEPGTVVARDKRVQGRSYVFAETGETIQYA